MDRLRGIARTLKKTYGSRATGAASAIQTRLRRISTGSLALDYALGGGVAVGRVLGLYGEQGGGKSTTATRIVGVAQNLCRRCLRPVDVTSKPPSKEVLEEDPHARWTGTGICTCVAEGLIELPLPERATGESAKDYKVRLEGWKEGIQLNSYEEFICVYIDTEDKFDSDWSEKLGADPRRIYFVRPTTGEEGVDMVTALMGSGHADLVVVDSLAHFVPRKEYEESAEDWQQGLQARIVNKGIRKWISGSSQTKNLYGYDPTLILINQTRMKIGVMFGDPTVKPAGKGQDFAATTEIKFLSSKVESIEDQYGSKKETTTIPISDEIRFRVTKQQAGGTKGVTGSYVQLKRDTDVASAGSIVEHEYIFKLAMHYLVKVTKKGSTSTYTLGDREWTSQKALLTELREDKVFFAAVRKTLLAVMLETKG